MRHKFEDELRVKVDHEHTFDPDEVDYVVDKVVTGAVTIIAVATTASIVRKLFT